MSFPHWTGAAAAVGSGGGGSNAGCVQHLTAFYVHHLHNLIVTST
jgi:hypothetical protein